MLEQTLAASLTRYGTRRKTAILAASGALWASITVTSWLVAGAVPGRADSRIPPGYEAAWQRIPDHHRALVGRIVVEDRKTGMAERRDRSIHLPPAGAKALGELAHEVGHIVFWADPFMAGEWRRQFWPGGRIVGTPASGYGRTNVDEDFSEMYQAVIQGDHIRDAERLTFMRERVFAVSSLSEAPAASMDVLQVVAPAEVAPCAAVRVPAGSVVAGCSAVPAGSVRP